MQFNHIRAYNELQKQHSRERELLKNAGFSNDDIQELFDFDIVQLNSDRSFFIHLNLFVEPDDELFMDKSEPDGKLDWLEQIENQILLRAILDLPENTQEIIRLHVVERFPLTFVATFLNKPYEQVKKRYFRAIEKIKKYF